MVKRISAALFAFAVISGASAYAQTAGEDSATPPADPNAALLNQDYLTATGATVPHPGVPQGSAETPLDRDIADEDKRIDNSICSNCR